MKVPRIIFVIIIAVLAGCNNNSHYDKSKQAYATEDSLEKITNNLSKPQDSIYTTMKGYITNIEKDALKNNHFRKVLYTSSQLQLVLMSLEPGEEIGEETHFSNDQFFRFESGHGKCVINGKETDFESGDVIIVPAGIKHNIINTDTKTELKLYTIYSPPQHKDGIFEATKQDAEKDTEKFDGILSEQSTKQAPAH